MYTELIVQDRISVKSLGSYYTSSSILSNTIEQKQKWNYTHFQKYRNLPHDSLQFSISVMKPWFTIWLKTYPNVKKYKRDKVGYIHLNITDFLLVNKLFLPWSVFSFLVFAQTVRVKKTIFLELKAHHTPYTDMLYV